MCLPHVELLTNGKYDTGRKDTNNAAQVASLSINAGSDTQGLALLRVRSISDLFDIGGYCLRGMLAKSGYYS